jgi:hypothetical protein
MSGPEGEFFSRLYIECGPATDDSRKFRNRLVGCLEANYHAEYYSIVSAAKQELGLLVPSHPGMTVMIYELPQFINETSVANLLDMITLIYRVLARKHTHTRWREFVARALRDENVGYSIDKMGGMHFFVDQEFERNKGSIISGLDQKRYAGVRAAFEDAHRHLDAQPPDTKTSVRSMFEALEILAKLMEPGSHRLNRQLVQEKLKISATWLLPDAIEVKALEKIFDGIADWVDAMHIYRHGQATENPVVPSIDYAVYALSSGAAALRLLLRVDAMNQYPKPKQPAPVDRQ